MPPIPERQPIGDLFNGCLGTVSGKFFLSLYPISDAETLAEGEFTVRYAIRYLGKPHISIVPGLVALDYGDMLTGEAAWNFLLHKSNLFPRADVLGYRNNGEDEMIVVKKLDLALPIEVLVFRSDGDTLPLASPAALIAQDTTTIAPRILHYLPVYPALSEWSHE